MQRDQHFLPVSTLCAKPDIFMRIINIAVIVNTSTTHINTNKCENTITEMNVKK